MPSWTSDLLVRFWDQCNIVFQGAMKLSPKAMIVHLFARETEMLCLLPSYLVRCLRSVADFCVREGPTLAS